MKTNAEHRADLIADPDDKRHGTRRGVELGCACPACRAERDRFNAERRAKDREQRRAAAAARKERKPKPPRMPSKDVCTVDRLMLPMMGKPSIDNEARACCVCGKPASDKHHIVRRGAGKLVVHGREVEKPTVLLCGAGSTSGCHGLAHANRLHFRWAEVASVDRASGYVVKGGHWEYILLDVPTNYQAALAMDGWRPL